MTKWDGSKEQWDRDESALRAIPYGHNDRIYGSLFSTKEDKDRYAKKLKEKKKELVKK